MVMMMVVLTTSMPPDPPPRHVSQRISKSEPRGSGRSPNRESKMHRLGHTKCKMVIPGELSANTQSRSIREGSTSIWKVTEIGLSIILTDINSACC